jgi:hypothetical protein
MGGRWSCSVKIDGTIQVPGALSSGRFFRTGYLPTYGAAFFLLILIWAGSPYSQVDFSQAWRTARQSDGTQVLLIVLVVALTALLLQPLQLAMVRVLEGGFPRWLGSGLACKAQLRRKRRLETRIQDNIDDALQLDRPADANEQKASIQKAGAVSGQLRSRFPTPDYLIRGTALGNALAATEASAGAAYGLDAVVVWPRLYPLLGDPVRAIVDDLRDSLDAAARMAATGALTTVAAVALLAWRSGWLTLLALAPLAVATLAYFGAVQAAIAYGTAVHVAFDLHRFDLLRALRLEVPTEQGMEKVINAALGDFFRQGIPAPFRYVDSGRSSNLPATGRAEA